MNRLFFVWIFCFTTFLFAGEKLTVAVTLAPYANIVRAIAGDKMDVLTLVPSNANPHTFEPKPAVLKKFAEASVYFSDGSGMDKAWMPRFKGVNPKIRIAELSAGISWLYEEHEDHEGHEDGPELDPHLWNSPSQVILISSNICSTLVEMDPANAGFYRTNLEAFNKKMTQLDLEFSNRINALPVEKRTFIVFHPSYGYLARDYGLTQIAVEMDGKEPKPRDLANLVREAKEHHVSTVFVQPQFSRRAAESLSREIKAKIVSIDPLAYDFEANLKFFLKTLAGEAK